MKSISATPMRLAENRSVRLVGRVALGVCFFGFVPLMLANAGVTNYQIVFSAIGVFLFGLAAATNLIGKADSLDLRGTQATKPLKATGLILVVLISAAFIALWFLQIQEAK